jgi:hypothetical protein
MLETFRRNRIARIAVGVFVLVVAFLVQYFLANIPLPVDIGKRDEFSPAKVRLGQDKLVIEGPVVNSLKGELLLHDGKANEVVEVHFNNARLNDVSIEDLSKPDFKPTSTPAKLDYVPSDKQAAAGEPCRTFLQIKEKDGKPPGALHFYQLKTADADRRRQLEMKAVGGEIEVVMYAASPPKATNETEGCRKKLQVGSLPSQFLAPSTDVRAIAADDSSFRFLFRPLDPNTPLWDGGSEGFYAPFELGLPMVKPGDLQPFQARAVVIKDLNNADPNSPPILSARSMDGESLLNVYDLKIGSDELQVKVSGKGMMSVNGKEVTFDYMKQLEDRTLPAWILTGANAALLAWFIRLLSKKDAPPAAE